MMTPKPSIRVRPTTPADIAGLTKLINEIIAIGGTTAHEEPYTPGTLEHAVLTGDRLICSHTAVSKQHATVAGYQTLKRHPELPPDWGDIATFAKVTPRIPGVGTALFAATKAMAHARGLAAINATIRADNLGGLAYYAKMGFEQYAIAKAVPLNDGTPVDRISKRLVL